MTIDELITQGNSLDALVNRYCTSVDKTIKYQTAFNQALRAGLSPTEAIRYSLQKLNGELDNTATESIRVERGLGAMARSLTSVATQVNTFNTSLKEGSVDMQSMILNIGGIMGAANRFAAGLNKMTISTKGLSTALKELGKSSLILLAFEELIGHISAITNNFKILFDTADNGTTILQRLGGMLVESWFGPLSQLPVVGEYINNFKGHLQGLLGINLDLANDADTASESISKLRENIADATLECGQSISAINAIYAAMDSGKSTITEQKNMWLRLRDEGLIPAKTSFENFQKNYKSILSKGKKDLETELNNQINLFKAKEYAKQIAILEIQKEGQLAYVRALQAAADQDKAAASKKVSDLESKYPSGSRTAYQQKMIDDAKAEETAAMQESTYRSTQYRTTSEKFDANIKKYKDAYAGAASNITDHTKTVGKSSVGGKSGSTKEPSSEVNISEVKSVDDYNTKKKSLDLLYSQGIISTEVYTARLIALEQSHETYLLDEAKKALDKSLADNAKKRAELKSKLENKEITQGAYDKGIADITKNEHTLQSNYEKDKEEISVDTATKVNEAQDKKEHDEYNKHGELWQYNWLKSLPADGLVGWKADEFKRHEDRRKQKVFNSLSTDEKIAKYESVPPEERTMEQNDTLESLYKQQKEEADKKKEEEQRRKAQTIAEGKERATETLNGLEATFDAEKLKRLSASESMQKKAAKAQATLQAGQALASGYLASARAWAVAMDGKDEQGPLWLRVAAAIATSTAALTNAAAAAAAIKQAGEGGNPTWRPNASSVSQASAQIATFSTQAEDSTARLEDAIKSQDKSVLVVEDANKANATIQVSQNNATLK